MSSNFGKPFTTTETTKAAGAEVVSDSIELSPRTKDHVLVVKADSSASGAVDVELEMSPDGNNWCPAVSKTVTSSGPSQTGNIIGNEKHVRLIPDTSSEKKNKHGRGLMTRNLASDTIYSGNTSDESSRTDAADFMYHRIQTTKSFNYSQWIKSSETPAGNETVTHTVTVFNYGGGNVYAINGASNASLTLKEGSTYKFDQSHSSNLGHPLRLSTTSNGTHAGGIEYTIGVTKVGTPGTSGAYLEITVAAGAPTLYYYCFNHSGMGGELTISGSNVYNPVLFRHAGYDDFSNTKVPQLTANVSSPENGNALEGVTTGNFHDTKAAVIQDEGSFDLTTSVWSYGFWFKSNTNVGAGNVPNFGTRFNGAAYARTLLASSIKASTNPGGNLNSGFYGGFAIQVRNNNNANNPGGALDVMMVEDGNRGHFETVTNDVGANLFNGQWHHMLVVRETANPNAMTASGFKVYIDGSLVTTVFSTFSSQTFTLANVVDKTTICAGNGHTQYDNGNSLPHTHTARDIASSFLGIGKIDNCCFWKSDQSANAFQIYNAGKPLAVNPGSPHAYLRFENSANLALNSITDNTVAINTSTATNFGVQQATLSSSESIYILGKATQNLCEPKIGNELSLRASSSTGNTIDYDLQGITNKNVFNLGGDNNFFDLSGEYSISFFGVIHNNTNFDAIIQIRSNSSTGHHVKIYQKDNKLVWSIGGNTTYRDVVFNTGTGPWATSSSTVYKHFILVKRNNGEFPSGSNMDLYIDGVKESAPSHVPTYGQNYYMSSFPSNLTVESVELFAGGGLFNAEGLNNTGIGGKFGSRDVIDQVAFFDKALSDGNVSSGSTATGEIAGVYTGSYYDLSGLPSSYNLKSYFKCGDGANDNKVADGSVKTFDAIGGTAFFAPHTGSLTVNGSVVISQNTSTREYWVYANDPGGTSGNAMYQTEQPVLKDNFTHAKDFSISCWVKIPTDHSGYGTIISNKSSSALADGLSIQYTPGNGGMLVVIFAGGSSTGILMDSALTQLNLHDNEWHHLVLTKSVPATGNIVTAKMYVDGVLKDTDTYTGNRPDSQFAGSNGFTLLGDGSRNANQSNPPSTDPSKTKAELSNCSIHSEELDVNAVAQMYSNGNVRNIKNLPSVDATKIVAWWQLNDTTNPENATVGTANLKYQGPGIEFNHIAIKGTPVHEIGGVYKEQNNGGLLSPNSTFNDYSSNDQTYNFWIYKPSNINGEITWLGDFSNIGGSERGYAFFSNSTYDLVFYVNDGTNYRYNGISLSGYEDQWIMVTFVTNANIMQSTFYINKIPVSSIHPNGSASYLIPTSQSIEASGFFGARTWDGDIFPSVQNASDMTATDCRIDEYSAFDGALSESEIEELYNDRDPLTHSRSSDVYRYIKFGDGSSDTESSLTCQVDSTFVLDKSSSAGGNYLYTLSSSEPVYVAGLAGAPSTLATLLVDATKDALVNDAINGHGMTMSITKSFNFTTKKWVSTTDQDAAICLSFNGFQEQAEYFALWKCSQSLPGGSFNILDGAYHNIILSYRGKNNFSGGNVNPGDIVKFGPGDATGDSAENYNWVLSVDGLETTTINNGSGADYIGGLNTLSTDTYDSVLYNVGFAIQDRHLRHTIGNTEEVYKPHTQFSSGILDSSASDNKHAFQGFVDETSFHSDTWWVNSTGLTIDPNEFNGEKPATIFGNTQGASNRGVNTEYPVGAPYPLRNPEKLVTTGNIADIEGTNQFINPNPFNATSNPKGGLEAFWRWGDSSSDCAEVVNDVKSLADGNILNAISAENLTSTDVQDLTSSDSIYISSATGSSGGTGTNTSFPQVKLTNIVEGMKIFNIVSPLLQYLRVKWKGAGSVDLGSGKGEAFILHTHRFKRRKN